MPRLAPHTWPTGDPALSAALARVKSWEPILSPILHDIAIERPEGPEARGYMSFAPKVLVRAFYDGEAEVAAGAVYFTSDACGSRPGIAHGGAVSSLLDNVLGVYAMRQSGELVMTRRLTTRFIRSTPLGTVLFWRCWLTERSGRTLRIVGEIRTVGGDELLAVATSDFMSTRVPFSEAAHFATLVRRVMDAGPPKDGWPLALCDDTVPWPAPAAELARHLVETGCKAAGLGSSTTTPRGGHYFDGSMSAHPKIRMQWFYRPRQPGKDGTTEAGTEGKATGTIYALTHFSMTAGGPPGRVNGGATLAAFDMAFDAAVTKDAGECSGPPTLGIGTKTRITVEFRQGVPLGCCALLQCRVVGKHPATKSGQGDLAVTGELLVMPKEEALTEAACWDERVAIVAATGVGVWSRPRAIAGAGKGVVHGWRGHAGSIEEEASRFVARLGGNDDGGQGKATTTLGGKSRL